jgi:hypothetical protein
MNTTEIIDKVVTFYKEGGNPGWDNVTGNCNYYVAGNRCAIGCLVSEEEAVKLATMYSGHSVRELIRADKVSEVIALLPEDIENEELKIRFLTRLQIIHDDTCNLYFEDFDGPIFPKEEWLRDFVDTCFKFMEEVKNNPNDFHPSEYS